MLMRRFALPLADNTVPWHWFLSRLRKVVVRRSAQGRVRSYRTLSGRIGVLNRTFGSIATGTPWRKGPLAGPDMRLQALHVSQGPCSIPRHGDNRGDICPAFLWDLLDRLSLSGVLPPFSSRAAGSGDCLWTVACMTRRPVPKHCEQHVPHPNNRDA